jgi:thiaminase/transcriptional activator TenA
MEQIQNKWMDRISQCRYVQGIQYNTLTQRQRNYYVAQDHYYLEIFGAAFNEVNRILDGLGLLSEVQSVDESDAHQALKPNDGWQQEIIGDVSKAYTGYIQEIMQTGDDLQKVLVMLPCLESYYLLAAGMKNDVETSDEYKGWIEYYTQSAYIGQVRRYRQGIVELVEGSRAEARIAPADLQVYEQAYQHEYDFWEQCVV